LPLLAARGSGEDGLVNARSTHPAGQGLAARRPLHDDIIGDDAAAVPGPACCCPANAVVRVVMPAIAARPHPTELLLCGHHYRVSRQALAAAGATVTELRLPSGSAPDALLPGPLRTRVPIG
jgi:hypothetical protein